MIFQKAVNKDVGVYRLLILVAAMVLLVSADVRGDDSPQSDSRVDSVSFSATVQPFLKAYCVDCHGGNEPKGDRRFDTLLGDIRDDNTLVDYQDIVDQLNLAEMPPADEKQPTDSERRTIVSWLSKRIALYHEQRSDTGRHTVLRRLNAREYQNTVRDLFHLDMTMFDPTSTFPSDQTSEHLDNIGDSLVTSGFLLAQYLDAAEQVVDKALSPRIKPPVRKWVFRDGFQQQPEIDQVHRKTNRFAHMTLYDVVGADKHEGAYGPILAFKEGVPHDGMYKIRVKAEAVNRNHPYDPEFLGTDASEPLRLGIVAGDHLAGQLHKPQPVEPLLAELDLADESKWYTVQVRLDCGFTPRFTFRNGLMDARNLWSKLLRKYPDQFPKRKNSGIVEARYNAIAYGKLPQIHIHEIEIEGPFFDAWPTAAQRALLGPDCERMLSTSSLTIEEARRCLTSFLSRAYRRPIRDEDVDRVMQVVDRRIQDGASPLDAYADGLKTAICSPHFLYLAEETQSVNSDPNANPLTETAIASRLSYFLWASMPDESLAKMAESGELDQPKCLRQQVDRMLKDPRSNAFVDGFLDSWLTLRDLGSMPPDRNRFRSYYHYDLGTAMRRETHLFTRHLIDENISVIRFLDADFTFVNKPLARMYGVAEPDAGGFQLVKLSDRRRGGLLGQASVLTVTANGIDTSPVVRGVWLLENILANPPSPPPPDVEPLDPDIRGATTIREQLEKHRDVASCNDCHRKIDPPGFALENFDAIGRWRDSYGPKSKVDASGVLPSGEKFDDIQGLKRILVQNQEQFLRALIKKNAGLRHWTTTRRW